jgi:sugar/nucleoside kinase (ribokinase family)
MVKAYDIITFGDMCVDLILSGGDIVPRFGQVEQLVDEYTLEMGGSTCIFACQAARLGLRTGILGKVGPDGFGRMIIQRLQDCGVDTGQVAVDPDLKTGLGVALVKHNDRAILTYPGSVNALTPAEVQDSFLASARHLHHGSYFLMDRLKPEIPQILRRAKAMGLTTSLDTNWDPSEDWNGSLTQALDYVDIFLPNQQELLKISGEHNLEAGIHALHAMGVKLVTVKLGENGALASDGNQILYCRVEPVSGGDSVGAGDSFDAGFLAGWLGGASLADCLRLACGCGRSVAGAIGGLEGQPGWDELQKKIGDLIVTQGSLP